MFRTSSIAVLTTEGLQIFVVALHEALSARIIWARLCSPFVTISSTRNATHLGAAYMDVSLVFICGVGIAVSPRTKNAVIILCSYAARGYQHGQSLAIQQRPKILCSLIPDTSGAAGLRQDPFGRTFAHHAAIFMQMLTCYKAHNIVGSFLSTGDQAAHHSTCW